MEVLVTLAPSSLAAFNTPKDCTQFALRSRTTPCMCSRTFYGYKNTKCPSPAFKKIWIMDMHAPPECVDVDNWESFYWFGMCRWFNTRCHASVLARVATSFRNLWCVKWGMCCGLVALRANCTPNLEHIIGTRTSRHRQTHIHTHTCTRTHT